MRNTCSQECWRVQATHPLAEELSAVALEFGAIAIEVLSNSQVVFYFEGHQAALAQFCARIEEDLQFMVLARSPIPEENWVAHCEDVWQPLEVRKLRIMPVTTEARKPVGDADPHAILITPGLGFGTGHHPSTRLALELLQEEIVIRSSPRRILDLGTGSGILALAAARLFPCHIDAADIDPLALENAVANLALNGVLEQITIQHTELAEVAVQYGLILANIYAEVLQGLEEEIFRHLEPPGMLLCSGILAAVRPALLVAFSPPRWEVLCQREDGEWSAFLLKATV